MRDKERNSTFADVNHVELKYGLNDLPTLIVAQEG